MAQVVQVDNGDVLYVDEEGLFKKKQALFLHSDTGAPIINWALYVGPPDSEGWDTDPISTLFGLFDKIFFVNDFGSFERAHYEPEEV